MRRALKEHCSDVLVRTGASHTGLKEWMYTKSKFQISKSEKLSKAILKGCDTYNKSLDSYLT